jgi:hypothetical protein
MEQSGSVAEPERPDEGRAGERQAEPELGRDADGLADGLDAAPDEVHEAAQGFTFNDAREAAGADNINRLSDDDLQRVAAADEGPQAQGDAVNRVHRLKALGNGIVPAVAHIFAAAIAEQLVALDADLEAAA